ncbi:MAG TPA: retropepsin-like aspartic protease [Lacunisphaera sp.]|nr:retropepsin-like aspartic protease [Lacunisphaera sp.]
MTGTSNRVRQTPRRFLALILAASALLGQGCVWYRFVSVPAYRSVSITGSAATGGPQATVIGLTQAADMKLYLDLVINGRPVRGVVDTGAYPTFFDKGALEEIGVRVDRTRTPAETNGGVLYTGVLSSLKIGGMEFKDFTCWSLDLSKERSLHARNGLPDFAVLLGADVLTRFRARIDVGKRELVLTLPEGMLRSDPAKAATSP